MFTKIILCATNEKLTAGIWRMGKMQSYQVLENNEQGHEDFKQFLKKNSSLSIYFIVDAIEEDYRVETLPHTSGAARQQILHRKLSQIYRGTEFRSANFISREKDKRKDDRFLLAALNNPDFLNGWLENIESEKAPLAGIYLLPLLSQVIAKRLKLTSQHLILSERLNSGLRQTYMENGRLRISRLATIPQEMENKLSYFYLVETEKTRLYLISQRLINRDSHLHMTIAALDESGASLICRTIEQEQGIECKTIDLGKFAISLKLDPRLVVINPELVHMQLLAMGNVPDSLAPDHLIKSHQVNYLRWAINFATFLIVLIGLGLSSFNLYESYTKSAEVDQLVHDRQIQEHLYGDAAKDFPAAPIPSADLQTAVEIDKTIVSNNKNPRRMMAIISKTLDAIPEIQLDRMRWVQASDINVKDEENKAGNAVPVPASPNAATQQVSSFTPVPNTLYEIGFINGEIKGFSGDYRSALASVNHLVELLKADPAIAQIVVLQAPVNVSSFTNLQGSTTDEQANQQQAALFKLRLILKREEEPAK